MNGDTVLEAKDLARYYPVHRGAFAKPVELKALDGASFTLERRKTLAVVGESGCGKSTLARLVTMIEPPTRGELRITGIDVATARAKALRQLRSKVQQLEIKRRWENKISDTREHELAELRRTYTAAGKLGGLFGRMRSFGRIGGAIGQLRNVFPRKKK